MTIELDHTEQAIIAIVKGGLGNQLFIYAAARALALRTGRNLYLDSKRGYTHDTFGRSYRLDNFPISAKPMPEPWRVAVTLKHPRHKLVRALNKLLPRDQRSYLAERHHLDATQLTSLSPCRDRITLLGYWQSEGYFADYAQTIRMELTLSPPLDIENRDLGDMMAETESVFLHIRRVRYSPLLDSSYYQRAINSLIDALDRPVFHVFGDDSAWARSCLDFHNAEVAFVAHNRDNELADLWLMGQCRHAITANSSFSWWGAWLGGPPGRDRLIFAPHEPGIAIRYPQSWYLIE